MGMSGVPGGDSSDDEEDEAIFAEINITPLTDVFLVLVIIFMISALAVQDAARREKQENERRADETQRSGLKVNLPAGAAQEINPVDASLTITIPLQGNVLVNDQPISDAELDNLLTSTFVKDKTTQVVLMADQGVSHGRVVNLMERAKKVGLSRLAIATSNQ